MAIEDDVNTAIKEATKDDAGKTVFPEGTSEAVIYAANTEMRRRDTQSALSKEQQANSTLKAVNEKITETWEQEVGSTLTNDQNAELEELKHTDPDAWHTKLNEYKAANTNKVKEKQKTISEEVGKETEIQRRARVLEEYNAANPELTLTDDVIANDIPPRITNKLANGEITFDDFLVEANAYLGTPKVVASTGDEVNETPDISTLGGSEKPTIASVDSEITSSYEKEVY
jgi:hypothetical protein